MQGYYESHRDSMERPDAWFARDDRFHAHFHEGVELVYVLEGEFNALLDGRAERAGAGEMLISGSYVVHAWDTMNTAAYIAIIPLGAVPSLKRLLTQNRFRSCVCPDDARRSLRILMELMVEHRNAEDETVLLSVSSAILGLLAEKVGLAPSQLGPEGNLLGRMLGYLEAEASGEISVDGLARRFAMSRSSVSHLFSAGVGMSLPRYVNQLRCRQVAKYLAAGEGSVQELALAAGYKNMRTFYNAFHALYGVTPKEYVRARMAPQDR